MGTITPKLSTATRGLATQAIPKTQKAVIFYEHGGPLHYQDVPVPTPGPNDILVNIKYTGVCNSDYHAWKGDLDKKPMLPLIVGHEGAGVVVAKGDNVKNFQIGDYAGIKWLNSTCNSCDFCEESNEANCPEQKNSGYSVQGTFQQYCIGDATQAAKIPQGTDLSKVAPILCAGLTAYNALKHANIKTGQWVTIIGAGGGLGSLAVQYAQVMGFKILGIDGPNKEEFVLSKGADAFIDFSKVTDTGEAVRKITGKDGPHAVINFSNSLKAYNDSVEYVRATGTVVLVGFPGDNAALSSNIYSHINRAINIKGSVVGNRADTREAIDFFVRGKVEIPVKIAGLSEASNVFKKMEEGQILGRYVLDTSY